jgi:hypothetical protein
VPIPGAPAERSGGVPRLRVRRPRHRDRAARERRERDFGAARGRLPARQRASDRRFLAFTFEDVEQRHAYVADVVATALGIRAARRALASA